MDREDHQKHPRPVKDSVVEMTEVVLPNDANNLGTMFGGKVMLLIDVAGAIAARRHSRRMVVTASVDSMSFHTSIKVGELVVLLASVNRAFNTSLEVGVKVFSENTSTGTRQHTASAYLTFVAIEDNGKPTGIVPVIAETDEQKRRYKEAGKRREVRQSGVPWV
ncbi:acyl-CoA thioesterase [bacterium]|nr:acyl-CoA thioesterase [bacterium]MBU1652291.1 acyl-CoA thioesterase [bacterium]MBU1880539.1 acyl-CoA thioesterase [bacterium]